eukprot:scaffold24564_cov30-Tisochrysis_lutea.AAC.4
MPRSCIPHYPEHGFMRQNCGLLSAVFSLPVRALLGEQVRQELTMQQPSFSLAAREVAVDLLEQCTRFHIMVEHRCCELGLRNL